MIDHANEVRSTSEFSPVLVPKTRIVPLPEKSQEGDAEVNYLYIEN
jgi:hypothetical protein